MKNLSLPDIGTLLQLRQRLQGHYSRDRIWVRLMEPQRYIARD